MLILRNICSAINPCTIPMNVDFRPNAIFTLQNDSASQSECNVICEKQHLECYSSCCNSCNSSSSNDSGDSLYSTSCTTTPSVFDAPPGPFSALDLSPEGRILCFDEKTNRLVSIDLRSNERRHFTVPLEFQFQHYYWSHLSEINKSVVLALLKKHRSRCFYLVTFNLLIDKAIAIEISRTKTKISSDGYQVSCQRLSDCFYFGFRNRVRLSKSEIRKTTSDIKLFHDQITAQKRNLSVDSGVDFGNNSNLGDLSEIDLENIGNEGSEYRTESVLLQVKCDENGQLESQIFSIGKGRLELSLSSPILDVEHLITGRSFSSAIETKYMTALPSVSLSDPFYYEGDAYFIDRADPKQAYAVEAIPNPQRGLIAAVQAKLRLNPTLEERHLRRVPIDCSMGMPPTAGAIWSSVQAGSNSAFVCVQETESLICSLWKLELEEEVEPEEPVTPRHFEVPDQLVEVHSSVDGEDQRRFSPTVDSLSPRYRTVIRIDTHGNTSEKIVDGTERGQILHSPSQNSQLSSIVCCADDSITGKGTLRWIKIGEDLRLPNFKLVDNMALRIDANKKYACIRGLKSEEHKEASAHCFILFPLSGDNDCCIVSTL
uniref:Ig-like domain-containing protein n=2 Tax=Parascaris univalens TaxID=6257 RepID=A0A914ZJA9_PARUN